MNESYAEAGVKRKATFGTSLIRVAMIVGIVVCIFVMLLGGFFGILGAAAVVFICYMFPRLNVEYEYIFCDGQLDFDKIMGKTKRKQAMRIDFEQVEIVAKETSHALDGYTYIQTDTKDFSSGNKDTVRYVIILNADNKKTKIFFEPNEKMLNAIKQKYPRKISMI